MNSHNLRKLDIQFSGSYLATSHSAPLAEIEESKWAELFIYPLRRLRGIDRLTITGSVSQGLASIIAHEIQSQGPALDIWTRMCRTNASLEQYRDTIHLNNLEYLAGKWAEFDELLCLASMPPLLIELDEVLFVNEEQETEMGVRIGDLEALMDGVGPAELLLTRLGEIT